MDCHADSSMASMQARMWGLIWTVIDQADPEPGERVDQRVGEEPRIGSHHEGTTGPRPTHPGDQFLDEPLVAPLRRALAHPGMENLAGRRPGGQERVIAEDPRVAIGGALLGLAIHTADRRVHVDGHR